MQNKIASAPQGRRVGRISSSKKRHLVALLFAIPLTVNAESPEAPPEWTYTLEKGDTVWDLARNLLVNWRFWDKVVEHNRIENPNLLQPGTRLHIPVDWLRKTPSQVLVLETRGECRVESGEGSAVPMKAGMKLSAGDILRTGKNASASLRFADGTRLMIAAESVLTLVHAHKIGKSGYHAIRVQLEAGRTDTQANPEHLPNNTFEIDSPAAVSAVRGTAFRINAAPGRTYSEVLEGGVAVFNPAGVTELPRGFGNITPDNAAPQAPKALIAAPGVSVPAKVRYLPAWFEIEHADGADSYRAQLANNTNFSALVHESLVTSAVFLNPELPNGDYALRVRGIDNEGLEGLNTVATFTVDAHPVAPVTILPESAAVIYGDSVSFSWETRHEGSSLLQLARTRDFSKPQSFALDSSEFNLEPLEPGQWYWRLIAEQADGRKGPPGQARPFTLRKVPPTLMELDYSVESGELMLNWRNAPGVSQFRMQFAHGPDFERIKLDTTTGSAGYRMPAPDTGTYFFRVATIDEFGFQGSWSQSGPINVGNLPKFKQTLKRLFSRKQQDEP